MFQRLNACVLGMGLVITLYGCASQSPPTDTAPPAQQPKLQAPLFNDLGSYSVPITTDEPLAQRFFDQGLTLTFGFNHAEAVRSFREAARLDPECAMCYWGIAFALGPNINMPMFDEAQAEAYSASQKALQLDDRATPREQALIRALANRYVPPPVKDRSALDRAFADAMREVARQFPDDAEAQTFFAESLMDLSPWDYWMPDGEPKPATREMIAMLERVLAAKPNHPGANHLYIHVIEASANPERAEAAADRLGPLAPGAGHLVHMPSHIYIRVGRYHDAAVANIKAGEADTSYIAQCQAQGVYPLLYHPHNWHFLWASATFAGKKEWAERGALKTRELMGTHHHDDPMFGPYIQHFWLTPLYHEVRFGEWDDILSSTEPENFPYLRAIWHYARGMAYGGKGDLEAARKELAAMQPYVEDPALTAVQVSVRNNAQQLAALARQVLAGDIEARSKNYDRAISMLSDAVKLEDALGYNEPEDWHYPVRQILGAVQLDAGRAADAERSYRDELAHHRENGWSLFGLQQSLVAQGRTAEATAVGQRLIRAWADADIQLTASIVR
jgi:tetratricopeptide (TPR) repeat protein